MATDVNNDDLYASAQKNLFSFGSALMSDVMVKTSGMYLYTASGKKIMDWTSGQMSCLIGHGHPEIVRSIAHHAANLDHLYSGMVSPPVIKLAETLTNLLPPGLDKAMFLSTGGESNECAIKLAKMYTGKFEIVGLGASWHGSTSGARGAQYHAGRKGYGPAVSWLAPDMLFQMTLLALPQAYDLAHRIQMPGMHMLPSPDSYRSIFRNPDGSYDWETELNYGWSLIDKASVGSLAAVIMEPVLSSGGMIDIPPGYMAAMKEHCRKRDMLLIVDEAQTALGRAGDIFAIQHEKVVPDILTLSKTLGNGLPLSAVITSNEIAATAEEKSFMFYTTHANDPLPAAVGLAVLQTVLHDNLVERSRVAGAQLRAGLNCLMERYGCIGAIRGRALMIGVEIVSDRKTKAAAIEFGKNLSARMMELGLSATISARTTFSGTIRIAPPLIITDEQIATGLSIFEQALQSTPGSMPLYECAG